LDNAKATIKRWNMTEMLNIGRQLFAKINKRNRSADHNHEIHFLAREIDDWLPQGVLCKALHKTPYAKQVLMQSKLYNLLIFYKSILFYFA
jgi:hypothetical protein